MNSGEKIPFGACVWSTGNTALDFVRELGLPLTKDGRIKIDEKLQVQATDGRFKVEGKKLLLWTLFSYGKKIMEKICLVGIFFST